MARQFSSESPYIFAGNNPIYYKDMEGLFKWPVGKEAEYEKKYPRLTAYLKSGDMNRLATNKTIVQALIKFSNKQLTEQDITNDFTYGRGLAIQPAQLDEACGKVCCGRYGYAFPKEIEETTIELDIDILDGLENSLKGDEEAYLLLAVSTIIHEYTHYGDRKKDFFEDGFGDEEGSALEFAVWGADLVDIVSARDQLRILRGEYDIEGYKMKNESVIPIVPDTKVNTKTLQKRTFVGKGNSYRDNTVDIKATKQPQYIGKEPSNNKATTLGN